MARKKEIRDGFHLKYIPAGRLNDLIDLANKCPYIKDKQIALTKYIELFSSIVERSETTDNGFVPVSQKVQKKNLGIDSKVMARLLKDLVDANILVINKKNYVIRENSYEYKPATLEFETIKVFRTQLNKTTDSMLKGVVAVEDESDNDVNIYRHIVKKLQFDNAIYDYVNKVYAIDMYKVINNNSTNVPLHISLVPWTKPVLTDISLVPFTTLKHEVCSKMPAALIPVIKILNGTTKVDRPTVINTDTKKKDLKIRVYSGITNLKRNFRKFLRLNGKELIGFDIANSQPLLAAIAFKRYSESEYGYIKDDVKAYQEACEQGQFYEYFMQKFEGWSEACDECNTTFSFNCEKCRAKFKGEFFGKVFFGKNLIKEPEMMKQFKEKYPTCYQAMYQIKGGEAFSNDYKRFPQLMTMFETEIIWETNIELINMGYDVVNIFDSLYSDSEEAIKIAKQKVIEKFATHGIKPTLKPTHDNASVKPLAAKAAPKTIEPMKDIEVKSEPANEVKKVVNPYAKKTVKVVAVNSEELTNEQLGIPTFQELKQKYWMSKTMAEIKDMDIENRLKAMNNLKKAV